MCDRRILLSTEPALDRNTLASWLGKILAVAGIAGLAAISWFYPAMEHIYEPKWELIFYFTLLVPPLLLLLQAFSPYPRRISRAWASLAFLVAAVLLTSALSSPYRNSALRYGATAWSGLALFFVVLCWIRKGPEPVLERLQRVQTVVGLFLVVMLALTIAQWLGVLPGMNFAAETNNRNPYPLGNSNLTAGLSLLMVATFIGLGRHRHRGVRAGWWLMAALSIGLLFTTKSRGGWLGLAIVAMGGIPLYLKFSRSVLTWTLLGIALLSGAGWWTLPDSRTTERIAEWRANHPERLALLRAGEMMANDRPFLGWGPGTVPLVYPLYRGRLAGGPDNVLQLQSAPLQLIAEGGIIGLFVVGLALLLVTRKALQHPAVSPYLTPFLGYAVFSLTDWQFDVPLFVALLAIGVAALAALDENEENIANFSHGQWRALGGIFLLVIAGAIIGVKRDPTTQLNTIALMVGRDPSAPGAAKALLEESLSLNPAQEISHFNFGWLQVAYEPHLALTHFRDAVHLAPDQSGVYFGIGQALLNQERFPEAVQAFALEALNDPTFLVGPWRDVRNLNNEANDLAAEVPKALLDQISRAEMLAGADRRTRVKLQYLRELVAWLERGTPVESADTPQRQEFFGAHPSPERFHRAEIDSYNSVRENYPDLMRDRRLPPPIDSFIVSRNALAMGSGKFLFPEIGWLDNRILVQLLSERIVLPDPNLP